MSGHENHFQGVRHPAFSFFRRTFILWFLFVFSFGTTQIYSQVSSYCFSQSSGSYTAISGGTVHATGTADNARYVGIPLGFSFTFDEVAYTSLSIYTNGFVTFGATSATASEASPISASTGYAGAIAAMGKHLIGTATGEIRSELLGTSGSYVFVIQWKGWARRSCLLEPSVGCSSQADNLNFQIRLYEGTDKIEVVYGTSTASATAQTMQVGLRGSANTDFNNRMASANWTTTAGTGNTSTCTLRNTILPAAGLTFTWLPAPSAPIATDGTRCATGTVTLSATGVPSGSNYKWYAVATGGSPLQTNGASYTTPSIAATTVYYVTTYNTNTLCERLPRIPVTATVNNIPATPGAITGTTALCSGTPGYIYSVAAVPSATTYTWSVPAGYTITSGQGTNSITVTSGSAGGNISVTSGSPCGTSSAATVAVTVSASPTLPTVTDGSRSNPGTVLLGAAGAGAGEDYKWYDASSGGSLLQTNGASYTTPTISSTTIYYVVKYQTGGAGCSSTPRTPVTAHVYNSPALNGYTITRTTGATYATIVGGSGTTAVTSWRNGTDRDDNLSNSLPIGFNFSYDGGTHSQFRISTEGFITFNNTTNAMGDNIPSCGMVEPYTYDNSCFTSVGKAGTLQSLAPFYNDLYCQTNALNSSMYYQLSGTFPNRILTIEWRGMINDWNNSDCSYSSGSLNFQIKLYEGTNNFEFLYGTMTQTSVSCSSGSPSVDDTYTLGVNSSTLSGSPTVTQLLTQQTANTNTFSNVPKNNLTALPTANTKITFTGNAVSAPGAVPGCASTLYPSDGSTNQCINSTLSWNATTGLPTTYELYFGTINPPPFIGNTTNTYYDPGTLSQNTTYYWKIVPRNSVGSATGCTVNSFSVAYGDVAATSITSSAGTLTGTSGTTNTYQLCKGTTATLTPQGYQISQGSYLDWTSPFIFDLGCKSNPGYPLIGSGNYCAATSITNTYNSTGTYKYEVFTRGCNGNSICTSIILNVIDGNKAPTGITAVPTSLCSGGSTTLTQTGGILSPGAQYVWYSGSCGGTLVGTGNAIVVSPSSTTTYYVRVEGGTTCASTTTCFSISVAVNSAVTAIPVNRISCNTGLTPFTMTGSSATGSIASVVWSGGGGLGTWSGSGTNPANYTFTPTTPSGSFTATLTINGVSPCAASAVTCVVSWTNSSLNNWIGVIDSDWFKTGNWSCGVPSCGQSVQIPNGTPNFPAIDNINGTGAACQSIDISSGASLTLVGSANLNVCGDWTNAGTFTPNTGTISLTGSILQTIYSATTFYNLTVNNTSTGIILSASPSVNGILTLTDGVVTTGGNMITVANTAANAIGFGAGNSNSFNNYPNSWINGNLRRYWASNTGIYDFPLGTATWSALARITNSNLSGSTYFDAHFLENGSYSNTGSMNPATAIDFGTPYNAFIPDGIWHIEPNVQPGSGTYRLQLYFNGFNQAQFVNNAFGIVKRPVGSTTASSWTSLTAAGAGALNANGGAGRLVSNGFASRQGMASFSHFGIGLADGPLPIELIDFGVSCSTGRATIHWTTKSERDNDYFTVERSVDGIKWKTLAHVNGAGNSSTELHYSTIDKIPFSGISYYRLSQTDFDGKSEVFNIVSTMCNDVPVISYFPNPFTSEITAEMQHINFEEEVSLQVYNIQGQLIYQWYVDKEQAGKELRLDLGGLETGVYTIRFISKGFTDVTKLVKDY